MSILVDYDLGFSNTKSQNQKRQTWANYLELNFVFIRSNMVGMEYILLHVQDPILYVIRKQHRHSPTEATPMADYYIIAGTIYQAPDLASVFNSRLVSALPFFT